jgi:hypothetical protein
VRIFCQSGPIASSCLLSSPLLSPLLVLVPRRPRQRSEGVVPSPLSTAERSHGEPMPNVFAAHPRHEPCSDRSDIVEDPLARWGHLAVPAFSLCRFGSAGARHTLASPFSCFWKPPPVMRQHFTALQSVNGQRIDVTSMPDTVLSCSRSFNLPA